MKPMAVILVARGHGLMAVINPKINAVTNGKELFSSSPVKNSIL
jgi:hypothetical protein